MRFAATMLRVAVGPTIDSAEKIGGDQVARTSAGTANDVARAVDQHPLALVAHLEVAAVSGRPGETDLVALDDITLAIDVDQDALQTVADDDVVFLGIDPANRRVVAVDVNALPGIAWPGEDDVVGRGNRGACNWIDRIKEVSTDEIPLDQVSHVLLPRYRDANGETVDVQPAQDAICRIHHEARRAARNLAAVHDHRDVRVIAVPGIGSIGMRCDLDRSA